MAKGPPDRGDGRDAKGRWKKGTGGNPNGRPRNVPDLDMADVYNFSQVATEIKIGGEKQLMTRHEVVLLKIFESALNERITAQKYLMDKFEEADMSRGYLRLWLERWARRIDDDPKSATMEVLHLMEVALGTEKGRHSKIRTRRGGKRKRN